MVLVYITLASRGKKNLIDRRNDNYNDHKVNNNKNKEMCEMEAILNIWGGGGGFWEEAPHGSECRGRGRVCMLAGSPELLFSWPASVSGRQNQEAVDGHGCALHNPLGSLRLTHSAVMQELWLLQVFCFDLFFLLNYKSSPGRRPSLHHNAGIVFLNGRGRWRTISPPTQRCHAGCL